MKTSVYDVYCAYRGRYNARPLPYRHCGLWVSYTEAWYIHVICLPPAAQSAAQSSSCSVLQRLSPPAAQSAAQSFSCSVLKLPSPPPMWNREQSLQFRSLWNLESMFKINWARMRKYAFLVVWHQGYTKTYILHGCPAGTIVLVQRSAVQCSFPVLYSKV
jgi:hypothetical protein